MRVDSSSSLSITASLTWVLEADLSKTAIVYITSCEWDAWLVNKIHQKLLDEAHTTALPCRCISFPVADRRPLGPSSWPTIS